MCVDGVFAYCVGVVDGVSCLFTVCVLLMCVRIVDGVFVYCVCIVDDVFVCC